MVSRTAEQHISIPLLRAAWETLTFVHWRVMDPAQVHPLLPEGLTVDGYDGVAWVGLTPFLMANMRPLGMPDLPAGMPHPRGSGDAERGGAVEHTKTTSGRTCGARMGVTGCGSSASTSGAPRWQPRSGPPSGRRITRLG
jgi:uncharacterized protein